MLAEPAEKKTRHSAGLGIRNLDGAARARRSHARRHLQRRRLPSCRCERSPPALRLSTDRYLTRLLPCKHCRPSSGWCRSRRGHRCRAWPRLDGSRHRRRRRRRHKHAQSGRRGAAVKARLCRRLPLCSGLTWRRHRLALQLRQLRVGGCTRRCGRRHGAARGGRRASRCGMQIPAPTRTHTLCVLRL